MLPEQQTYPQIPKNSLDEILWGKLGGRGAEMISWKHLDIEKDIILCAITWVEVFAFVAKAIKKSTKCPFDD